MDTRNDMTEFVVFEAGSRLFAVAAEEVAAVVEQKVTTRLPRSPAAVVGVVCVRGQMLTALSPLALTGEKVDQSTAIPLVIALRGDEQLALAADRYIESVRTAIEPAGPANGADSGSTTATIGAFIHEGRQVVVLDTRQLFAAAMDGVERRRRRSP